MERGKELSTETEIDEIYWMGRSLGGGGGEREFSSGFFLDWIFISVKKKKKKSRAFEVIMISIRKGNLKSLKNKEDV